jgi:arginyl-tRNA synthetase
MLELESKLISELEELLKEINPKLSSQPIVIETPRDKKFGDLSTNIAMKISSQIKKNPIELAEYFKKKLEEVSLLKDFFEKIDVISPGFLNFYFSGKFLRENLKEIIKLKQNYGKNNIGNGKKILIEFVSANPTGPLSIAHGRQAVIGNALANILEFSNYKVDKEYYINDEGKQIELLGVSLKKRFLELKGEKVEFPSDGYKGEYLIELAKELISKNIDLNDNEFFKNYAVDNILNSIKRQLKDFGIEYNRWRSQKKLIGEGKIEEALERLKNKDFIYKKDNAMWFKSTQLGDDRDRVIKKQDGSYTYFASDIAYHLEKFQLGYDLLINIWGPDHHGYIPRVKAAVEALGYNPQNLKILIVQLATIYKNGKPIVLSTREGKILTLKEVTKEVGKDATIYFLLMRKLDSHLDFDLDLAKKQSLENPVYYIQYAHARISSIINFAKENGYNLDDLSYNNSILDLLKEDSEKHILRIFAQFPRIIKIASISLEPSILTTYLYEVASCFHSFYNKHRVVTNDKNLSLARLILCLGVKEVLKKGLNLLDISAPEKM